MCGSCFSPSGAPGSPPLDTISSSSLASVGTTAAAPAGPCSSEDMCGDGSKDVFDDIQGSLDQEGAWGPSDMVLVGNGWKLGVHKQVLRGEQGIGLVGSTIVFIFSMKFLITQGSWRP